MSNDAMSVAIDIGKTGARAALVGPGEAGTARVERAGSSGLAGPEGHPPVLRLVRTLWDELAGTGADLDGVTAVGVGVVGFTADPAAARSLLAGLGRWRPGLRIVLTSDVVTSHAGALGGAAGTVLAVGTGSVALAVCVDGTATMVDGWGHLLGDDGSGCAVGRAGLVAAVRHDDGRGGSAALHRRATARYGALQTLPRQIHGSANPAAELAAFAPEVAGAAQEGDEVATAIWEQAAQALACTAAAAAHRADPGAPVAVTGGLLRVGEVLTAPLARCWQTRGLGGRLRAADGDAVTGAVLLATRTELPHTALTIRHEPQAGMGSGGSTGGGRPAAAAGDPPTWELPASDPRPPDQTRAPKTPRAPGDSPTGGLGLLDTERVLDGLDDLDLRSTTEIMDLLAQAEEQVQVAVAAVAHPLAAAVDTIVDRLRAGGRLFYVGAGTPGRLACVDASELPPTFGIPGDLVVPVMAGGDEAVFAAQEGAEDDEVAARRDLDRHRLGPEDVVVALSASGRTPYVLSAAAHARSLGAATIGVSNNAGAQLSDLVDHPVEVLTGPEVVAGSTRLKAGTSQKLVLNSLSTTVMIRLGKTHGPWMVDLHATNDKLRARAVRMVGQITGAPAATARQVLADSDGHIRTAIVMVAAGVDAQQARDLLAASGDSSRAAIAAAATGPSPGSAATGPPPGSAVPLPDRGADAMGH